MFKKYDIGAKIALFSIIIFFSGAFSGTEGILKAFDFNTLIGSFGAIGEGGNFVGKGGVGARQGFMFSISLMPGIMFALAAVEVATFYGALRAAQDLLSPILRPILGLPGITGLTIVSSMQSTDAGGAMTRELYLNNKITDKERTILAGFQFSAGATITVYLTAGMAVIPFLEIPILLPLGIILFYKIVGTNIFRCYLKYKYKEIIDNRVKNNEDNSLKKDSDNKNVLDVFVDGAKKGWTLCTMHLLPNVLMAFVIIQMFNLLGLLDILSTVFEPFMALFNLPGIAATVLLTAWLSGVAGAAAAASLFLEGHLTNTHIAILLPGIFLMGAQLQYMGRVLAVAGVNSIYYPVLFLISIINAIFAMFTMTFIV